MGRRLRCVWSVEVTVSLGPEWLNPNFRFGNIMHGPQLSPLIHSA